MAQVDDVHRDAESGDEDRRALSIAAVHCSVMSPAAVRRSTPNGLSVSFFARDLADHLVGRHRGRAEAAEAAGLGDRGDELVVATRRPCRRA